LANHVWAVAREAALARDDHTCQRCGHRNSPEPQPWEYRPDLWDAPEAAYERDHRAWAARWRDLEVNHKVPIMGAHGRAGCHHHLSGLETLCRDPCHLAETARQRRERALIRRVPDRDGQLNLPGLEPARVADGWAFSCGHPVLLDDRQRPAEGAAGWCQPCATYRPLTSFPL
jgi:5-methylcytosine-specific restriction endonuclease McrA